MAAVKRGRPPLDRTVPSTMLSVRVTGKQFDTACAQAAAARVTLSEWMRLAFLSYKNRQA